MTRRIGIIWGAAALCLLAPHPASAVDNVAVHGKVLFRGKPFPGAVVSVLSRSVKTGPDGSFRLEGVPALHGVAFRHFERAKDGTLEFLDVTASVPFLAVSAYAEAKEGGILGFFARKIFLAGARVIASGDAGRGTTISLEEVKDWEEYCRGCHPTSLSMEPGAVLRPAKEEAKAPPVTRELYARHRFRDSHPSGFAYGEARARAAGKGMKYAEKVEGIPLGEGMRVDCMTCHTAHVPTESGAFAREPFRESNLLCQRCHR